ncbi:MAG: STAS domain-containing protein [Candidatus Marinimicrobia bacterium]|jgi:anti-anti-sigma factor|nr:STAS domain-containing protein [Candidatus Neomarinimicrobiota bacterium]MBT3576558.1 STAS domain-containing protein [Candidatus Neomarinimicrobiota bacterium]MBT3680118.1 STAS domain-containing protein [Candidatus Neomarinimicrobiota bacterium]MBT3951325.1 STAS domain-containing protein [Candidatus Neomarinimicrobiota bacterium]MBT4253070.1 STAS domain-containing protein [Candidatus Neomarinimicrobiota bacterium]
MEMNIRKVGAVDIVDVHGNLDTSTALEAENFFTSMIEEGARKIVVNGIALDYISSAGLRVLLVSGKKLKELDGELRLAGLNESVTCVESDQFGSFDLNK